jgi:hypothetical protein
MKTNILNWNDFNLLESTAENDYNVWIWGYSIIKERKRTNTPVSISDAFYYVLKYLKDNDQKLFNILKDIRPSNNEGEGFVEKWSAYDEDDYVVTYRWKLKLDDNKLKELKTYLNRDKYEETEKFQITYFGENYEGSKGGFSSLFRSKDKNKISSTIKNIDIDKNEIVLSDDTKIKLK